MKELITGDFFVSAGQTWRVHEIREDQVLLENKNHQVMCREIGDFLNAIGRGEVRPVFSAEKKVFVGTRVLTIAEREAYLIRLRYMRFVREKHEQALSWVDIHRETVKRFGNNVPCMRTLQRWWDVFKIPNGYRLLAPEFSKRGNRTRRVPILSESVLFQVIDEWVSQSDKFTISQVTERVNVKLRGICEEQGIEVVGVDYKTVARKIKKLLHIDFLKGRVDRKTFRSALRAARERFFVEYPFERVELDSTTLDVFVVDDSGELVARPTLYTLIDCATGAILGFYLSMQSESQDTFLRLIEMAFVPRDEKFKNYYGIENLPAAPSIWKVTACDNSAAHHGQAMARAMEYLGSAVNFSKAAEPQSHPFVERINGYLNSQVVHAMPGSTVSQEPWVKDAVAQGMRQACLTIDDVRQYVARWIFDVYMIDELPRLTRRFGKRCSPQQAMNILIKNRPIVLPPSPEEFRDACMRYETKKVVLRPSGIRYKTFEYNSSDLYKAFLELPRGEKVEVRAHPLDVSKVYVVFPGDEKKMVVANNKDEFFDGMSFHEAKLHRKGLYRSYKDKSADPAQRNRVKLLEDIDGKAKSRKVTDRRRNAAGKEKQQTQQRLSESQARPNINEHAAVDYQDEIDFDNLAPLETR